MNDLKRNDTSERKIETVEAEMNGADYENYHDCMENLYTQRSRCFGREFFLAGFEVGVNATTKPLGDLPLFDREPNTLATMEAILKRKKLDEEAVKSGQPVKPRPSLPRGVWVKEG